MLSFESDYTTGAHIKILEALTKTNLENLSGYGNDIYCENAKKKIKEVIKCPDAEIFFLTGGTQTNSIIIASMLNQYEGVIAADTGHVNVHEAGAIEYTGHKVLTLPNYSGKISAEDLKNYMEKFYNDETYPHMVFPGMVYISHPTEYGTLYEEKELAEIYKICQKYNMPLYIDGARLGYGVMSNNTDVSIDKLAKLCDVFYIGGTKVGALCGEAVVFTKNNAPKNFITITKQHGAMLAKGRLLGIQFDTLFTDNLYFNISKHAINMAEKLKALFIEKGYKLYINSPTNQQFIIIDNISLNKLKEQVKFSIWEPFDENNTVVRFVTSWSTTEEDIENLNIILNNL